MSIETAQQQQVCELALAEVCASRHSASIETEGASAGGPGAAPDGAGLMCGIYGVVMRPGLEPDAVVLGRMGRTLIHRGPDGDGSLVEGRAGLGCRRLAIIDGEHAAQPLANDTGDVLVACNGEIYNHRALRERLERTGHRFRTGSDAEVIPHLYEERGLDFVDELEGMFGLALWDSSAQRLVLARDRMGEKPLYYASTPAGLLFASEPKAILASGLVDREADPVAIAGFLRTGYVAAPRSPYRSEERRVGTGTTVA